MNIRIDSPTCQPKARAASASAMNSLAFFGSALRPDTSATRSSLKYSPTRLPEFVTLPLAIVLGKAGKPCFPAGKAFTEYDDTPTCRTYGSRARLAATFDAYKDTVRSEGRSEEHTSE